MTTRESFFQLVTPGIPRLTFSADADELDTLLPNFEEQKKWSTKIVEFITLRKTYREKTAHVIAHHETLVECYESFSDNQPNNTFRDMLKLQYDMEDDLRKIVDQLMEFKGLIQELSDYMEKKNEPLAKRACLSNDTE